MFLKIKRLSATLLILILFLFLFAGCSRSENPKSQDTKTGASSSSVDVDLTLMSSVMVYAEVNNILTTPDKYMGKTIKISGSYYPNYYEPTDNYYHYVVNQDASSCCQQGLEFIWSGEHKYPDDYPQKGAEIEITGVFGSYEELGITYYYLKTDNIKIFR